MIGRRVKWLLIFFSAEVRLHSAVKSSRSPSKVPLNFWLWLQFEATTTRIPLSSASEKQKKKPSVDLTAFRNPVGYMIGRVYFGPHKRSMAGVF